MASFELVTLEALLLVVVVVVVNPVTIQESTIECCQCTIRLLRQTPQANNPLLLYIIQL